MKNFSSGRQAIVGGVCAVLLSTAGIFPAHAQDRLVVVEPSHATTYLNGGIGSDEEQYMRSVAADWPLRLTFAQSPSGDFVAGVRLLITNEKGTPYLQSSDAGPMTYVRLPPGKWRIVASYQGKSETREVTLDGKTGRDVFFGWKDTAAQSS